MSEIRKLLILAAVAVAAMVLLNTTPLKQYMENYQALKAALNEAGYAAPLIFCVVSTVLMAFGAPRLPFYGMAGAVFGFVEGMLWAQLASLVGAYGTFLAARWAGGDWVTRRLRDVSPWLHELLHKPSINSVILLRNIPIAAVATNLLLGASGISTRNFLLGTFIGYLPEGAIVCLIGSGLGKGTSQAALMQLTAAGVLLIIASLWGWKALQRRKAETTRSGT